MQSEPVPPWIILSTALIAIGICCAGLLLTGPLYAPYLPGLPARAARATATPRPTFTLIPTRTATPTQAPVIPTPRPTLTPATGLALERYKFEVTRNLTDMSNALVELGPLLDRPRIGQNDWTIAVGVRFGMVRLAHDNLAGMKPPIEAEEFHAGLISATADCSAATRQLSRGVDDLDVAFLESANELINSCNAKLRALPVDFLQ